MNIVRKVIALFISLSLLLVCVATGYIAQREYQSALDELVAEALARVQNRPALELYLYRQDESGLYTILEDLLQSDAVSVAAAYNSLSEMLAMRDVTNTPHRQLPSLELIRSNLSRTDTGLNAFDSEQKLSGIGFWSSLMASDPTIHLTTPIYSPVNPTEKGLAASNFVEINRLHQPI